MLLLQFNLGEDRYVLDSRLVAEVIPRITLRTLPRAPEGVVGLFNYRGLLAVPVVDLRLLALGHPCRPYLSTRIILVHFPGEPPSPYLLGLLAERVTRILPEGVVEPIPSRIGIKAAPYLGEIAADREGLIQSIRLEQLLPESLLDAIFAQAAEEN